MVKCLDHKIVSSWNSSEGHTMENWNWILCGNGLSSVMQTHLQPGSQPNAISQASYTWALLHKPVIIDQGLWDFLVSWFPGFVLDPPLWGGLGAKSGRPWHIIHWTPSRTPSRFFYPFKLSGSLRPSSSCINWSGVVLAFLTNERFWIWMVTGPQALVWSATY